MFCPPGHLHPALEYAMPQGERCCSPEFGWKLVGGSWLLFLTGKGLAQDFDENWPMVLGSLFLTGKGPKGLEIAISSVVSKRVYGPQGKKEIITSHNMQPRTQIGNKSASTSGTSGDATTWSESSGDPKTECYDHRRIVNLLRTSNHSMMTTSRFVNAVRS